MRAIAINAFGGPNRLELMELPIPKIGPDQVLIRVKAAGVSLWDIKVRENREGMAEGQAFPIVLGWESAGVIAQVGREVTGLKEGDQVFTYAYQ